MFQLCKSLLEFSVSDWITSLNFRSIDFMLRNPSLDNYLSVIPFPTQSEPFVVDDLAARLLKKLLQLIAMLSLAKPKNAKALPTADVSAFSNADV